MTFYIKKTNQFIANGVDDKTLRLRLKEQGLDITNTDVAKYSILAGVAMVLIALLQCWLFEKSLRKGEKADV